MYYWRYLQIVNADFFINIILHKNSMFDIDQTPYISYCVYSRSTSEFVHKSMNIPQMDEHLFEFQYEGNCCSPLVFESKDLSINGLIVAKCASSPIIQVLSSQRNKEGGTWKILIPYGEFEGYIRTEYFSGVFKAHIYQDEQCGKQRLQDTLKRWVWYSVIEEGIPYIHFSTESVDGTTKSISIVGLDKTVHTLSNEFNETAYNSVLTLQDNADIVELSLDSKIVFKLNKSFLLRNRIGERYGDYYFNYKRYVTQSAANEQINGACEIMSFEKRMDMQ